MRGFGFIHQLIKEKGDEREKNKYTGKDKYKGKDKDKDNDKGEPKEEGKGKDTKLTKNSPEDMRTKERNNKEQDMDMDMDKAKDRDKDIIRDNENDTDQDISQASCLPRPPPWGRRSAAGSGRLPWLQSTRLCTLQGLERNIKVILQSVDNRV